MPKILNCYLCLYPRYLLRIYLMLTDEEQDWLSMLHRDDEKAMHLISTAFYEDLFNIAFNFLEREELAKEVTNKALLDFWKGRKRLNIQSGM